MKLFSRSAAMICAALFVFALASGAFAQKAAYVHSTNGEPWGLPDSINAMDTVFGAGGWNDQYYQTIDVPSVFSSATCFVYMDGGDGLDYDFYNFLSGNRAAIENWVSQGGSLFLNAAQWDFDMDYGFGGVTNLWSGYAYASFNGYAATAHPIFTDLGFGAPGTSWTGNFFSHGIITGPAGNVLINGDAGAVLTETSYGAGHVLFGNMTAPFFQQPGAEAMALRENILLYGSQQCADVPEPGVIAFGVIVSGSILGLIARKRRA